MDGASGGRFFMGEIKEIDHKSITRQWDSGLPETSANSPLDEKGGVDFEIK
jgi:hypothetical protein